MASPLSKNIGREIPADQGKAWIKKFQDEKRGSIKAVFYGSNILEAILAQKDCVGIRIYNAVDDNGISTFVLVGAKENGNNIWVSTHPDGTPNGILGDWGSPCPPGCADNE